MDTERPRPVSPSGVQGRRARDRRGGSSVRGDGFHGVLPELAAYRRRDEIDDRSTAEQIDPRTLMVALDDLLPPGRAVAIDSGHFMGWPAMYLRSAAPDEFVMAQAFQSVGLGLATAIGASVARRDRITLAVIGDGGRADEPDGARHRGAPRATAARGRS